LRRASEEVGAGSAESLPGAPWSATWTVEAVIETLEPLASDERQARIQSVLEQRLASVTVLLDAPHDPHNGSAVMRSCDAFGIPTVHVVPREEAFLIARRITKGTERWLEVHNHASAEAAAEYLQRQGFELVATHPQGELTPPDLAHIPRLALLLGNEHEGICASLQRAASRAVRIPMRGFVESLNVSVAAAVLLAAATQGRPGDLPLSEKRRLYARALFRSVPRAGEILAARAPLAAEPRRGAPREGAAEAPAPPAKSEG
jgi:tRNA (guanosine-2'-O-)-methyltransferase